MYSQCKNKTACCYDFPEQSYRFSKMVKRYSDIGEILDIILNDSDADVDLGKDGDDKSDSEWEYEEKDIIVRSSTTVSHDEVDPTPTDPTLSNQSLPDVSLHDSDNNEEEELSL